MSVDDVHALVTKENFKMVRGLVDDKYNELIDFLIDGVSLYVENECGGRIFIEATYTDALFDGTGSEKLNLPNYPISTVTSIHENDSLLTAGRLNDYVVKGDEGEGYVQRIGEWAEGVDNIKVTYKAGYLLIDVPKDLKLACMIMMEKEFQKFLNKAGAEESRTFPDMALTWDFSQDEFVKKIIRKYRREKI